jgi:magnesium transporter
VTSEEIVRLRETIAPLPSGEAAARLATCSEDTAHAVLAGLPPGRASEIAALMQLVAPMPADPGAVDPAGDPAAGQHTEEQAAVEQAALEQAAVEQAALEPSTEAARQVEGTVASLLQEPFGVMAPETTVAGALDRLVHTQPVTGITYIYVVDAGQRLQGVVAMRDLLLGRPGQTLAEIMTARPFTLRLDTPLSEAIHEALVRRFRLYPVTDDQQRLLGLVYGWQLFESMATELSVQSGTMVGVDREERLGTPVLEAFRMRHPWLQVNLLTAFAAALVVGLFEDTITRIVALAAFLPVLAGQSGNTGCQALAITLRGITLGELEHFPVRRLLRKEVTLGALNGLFVGLVAALVMWLYASATDAERPALLALTILIAMVGACIGSGIFGVLVPLTLRRFGADPAMASSIFLTTFTDVLGMGLMLFLATRLVL